MRTTIPDPGRFAVRCPPSVSVFACQSVVCYCSSLLALTASYTYINHTRACVDDGFYAVIFALPLCHTVLTNSVHVCQRSLKTVPSRKTKRLNSPSGRSVKSLSGGKSAFNTPETTPASPFPTNCVPTRKSGLCLSCGCTRTPCTSIRKS